MDKNELRRWLKSVLISLLIFLIFAVYLYLRRGYFNLYIANKVFGSAAAVLAGITLLLGPLARRFTFLTSFVIIRRHLGLLAFGFAIIHIFVSLSQQNRFPSWYLKEWFPVLAGLAAIVVWGYMVYLSRNKTIKTLGPDLWKKRLSFAGWIGFIAIFLHLTVMKYQGWIRWFNGQVKKSAELANPEFPPASLFVFFIMLVVIVYRVVNIILVKRQKER